MWYLCSVVLVTIISLFATFSFSGDWGRCRLVLLPSVSILSPNPPQRLATFNISNICKHFRFWVALPSISEDLWTLSNQGSSFQPTKLRFKNFQFLKGNFQNRPASYFFEILLPSSQIMGHKWNHDLARSCFLLKTFEMHFRFHLHFWVQVDCRHISQHICKRTSSN